jgi:hypothetical protein
MPIQKWAMKQYQANGPINKMIFTGFHNENEWYSVLFQMISALYTMEIHNIAINNFSIRRNIHIKDLKTSGNIVGYWKYIIDDIPYYVPNYGHLVMIDTSFNDIPGVSSTVLDPSVEKKEIEYKIYAKQLDVGDSIYIKDHTFKNFLDVLDPSNWGTAFINKGGVKPPEVIMALIEKIYLDAKKDITQPNFTIGKYIKQYFKRYIHNRVGTLLRVTEIPNIIKENPNDYDCQPGKIFIREIRPNSQYQCVMVGGVNTMGDITVYTKTSIDDKDYKEENISIKSLFKYSPYEYLEQNYKPDEAKLNEQDLLDIYICKK